MPTYKHFLKMSLSDTPFFLWLLVGNGAQTSFVAPTVLGRAEGPTATSVLRSWLLLGAGPVMAVD